MQSKDKWGGNLRFIQIFGLLLIAVLTGGCNGVGTMDIDTTVYTGERYEMTVSFRIPAQFLSLAGGTDAIESKLDDMVAETHVSDPNEKITWRRDKDTSPDEVGYIIESSGTGFEGDAGFTIEPIVYQGKDVLRFDASFEDFIGMSSFTFTLHGGEILKSNGTEVEKGTVLWDNPYEDAYAVFTPKSRINWLYTGIGIAVVLGCSGALLIGALVVFLLFRHRNATT